MGRWAVTFSCVTIFQRSKWPLDRAAVLPCQCTARSLARTPVSGVGSASSFAHAAAHRATPAKSATRTIRFTMMKASAGHPRRPGKRPKCGRVSEVCRTDAVVSVLVIVRDHGHLSVGGEVRCLSRPTCRADRRTKSNGADRRRVRSPAACASPRALVASPRRTSATSRGGRSACQRTHIDARPEGP